jgi:hypothetical protein
MRRRIVFGIVALLSPVLLVGGTLAPFRSADAGPTQAEGPRERGASQELAEQTESNDQRLEALDAARAAGTLGRTGVIRQAPATGWSGERLMGGTADDWEPAIAADPNASYVYILHNRYGGPKPCPNSCPDPAMIVNVSKDGGKTFGPDAFLCICRNTNGQFDPLIEVVRNTGAVYASWMNDSDIMFSRSLDHGATWSTPVGVFGNVSWGDKPQITTSADGSDVYISFNGPTDGDPWIATSHDSGATWTQTKVTDSKRYYFEYGSAVVPNNTTIVFSEISFTYSGPGAAAEGPVLIHVFRSIDHGATWTDAVIDTVQLGTPCISAACYPDFYDSGPALAMDAAGDLVMVYSGAITAGGPRTVFATSSRDGGATWSSRVTLSLSGVNSAFPAAAGAGNDGVRVWFQDQRTGRWNTWYTTSSNLGATWSSPVKISDATSGTAYKNTDGYLEVYGDYGEIAVTNTGKTVAVWGEGTSYAGPGGVWFNRQK